MGRITLIVEFDDQAWHGRPRRDRRRAPSGKTVPRDAPGTLQYDWWLGADRRRDIGIEAFAGSDALAYHVADTVALVPHLVAAADVVRVDALGELTEIGCAATEAASTGCLSFTGGVVR